MIVISTFDVCTTKSSYTLVRINYEQICYALRFARRLLILYDFDKRPKYHDVKKITISFHFNLYARVSCFNKCISTRNSKICVAIYLWEKQNRQITTIRRAVQDFWWKCTPTFICHRQHKSIDIKRVKETFRQQQFVFSMHTNFFVVTKTKNRTKFKPTQPTQIQLLNNEIKQSKIS